LQIIMLPVPLLLLLLLLLALLLRLHVLWPCPLVFLRPLTVQAGEEREAGAPGRGARQPHEHLDEVAGQRIHHHHVLSVVHVSAVAVAVSVSVSVAVSVADMVAAGDREPEAVRVEEHARWPEGKVDPGVAVVAALAVDRVSNDVGSRVPRVCLMKDR